MFQGIDLASDTVTIPTKAMKSAMLETHLGDEQRGEDPTTLKLEQRMAELCGLDEALFFPSATMANQVALKFHLKPGEELIAAEDCHLFFAEAGGPAINAQALAKPLKTSHGIFTADDVRQAHRWNQGPHYPITRLVSVENTTNMGGGSAWDLATLDSVLATAHELNLSTHLDGSRIFNAAIKLGVPLSKLTAGFDTVTICLSKGLGCPIGALLAFKKGHWSTIRRLKQLMGGALRQSGMLAAAGLYALEHNVERLAIDHEHATLLMEGLQALSQDTQGRIQVESHPNATNMVFFSVTGFSSSSAFNDECSKHGLRFSIVGANRLRAVTHLGISHENITTALQILSKILRER